MGGTKAEKGAWFVIPSLLDIVQAHALCHAVAVTSAGTWHMYMGAVHFTSMPIWQDPSYEADSGSVLVLTAVSEVQNPKWFFFFKNEVAEIQTLVCHPKKWGALSPIPPSPVTAPTIHGHRGSYYRDTRTKQGTNQDGATHTHLGTS